MVGFCDCITNVMQQNCSGQQGSGSSYPLRFILCCNSESMLQLMNHFFIPVGNVNGNHIYIL